MVTAAMKLKDANSLEGTAFRLYRQLERFLARKGLAPQEHAMWFGLENEPR